MIDIIRFAELVSHDHGLAVVALALPDRTVHTSVASAGVLDHPVTGVPPERGYQEQHRQQDDERHD
jgi:hypothetical protein